jgi:hypothetical protein
MAKPAPFNGHHCWNCWNVSLWIGNDEGLYRAALECARRPRTDGKKVTANLAALRFARDVMPCTARTPDGARYTHKAVRAALAEFLE